MAKLYTCLCFLGLLLSVTAKAQKIYSTSGGEFIFGYARLTPVATPDVPVSMRFSMFLHLSNYWNYDLTNSIGLFSGLSLRNIGFISSEEFHYKGEDLTGVKTKRRSYALGIPFALKAGSFRDHLFLYGGAQYEWLFHYKEKHFPEGKKVKTTEWFSNQTNTFVPSWFIGMQLPKGANLRFTGMLDNFLNPAEFPQFSGSRLYYISLSFSLKTKAVKDRIGNAAPKNYAYISTRL